MLYANLQLTAVTLTTEILFYFLGNHILLQAAWPAPSIPAARPRFLLIS